MEKALNYKFEDQPVSWNTRDLLLYAVGIGAKAGDIGQIYENDEKFNAFPTYPVVLNFKGDSNDVVDFVEFASKSGGSVPGLPDMDPTRILHGAQYCELIKPLPVNSSDGNFHIKKRIVGVNENPKGIVVDTESILVDGKGEAYARMFSSTFNVGAKATGKQFSKAIAVSPQAKPKPERAADHVVSDLTTEEQAIVYRLSGDYNPLHVDPSMAKMAGFKKPILHGLATFGIAARALVGAVGDGDQLSIEAIGCRFTSPVIPGDRLSTHIWKVSDEECVFEMKNETQNGKTVLGKGYAKLRKSRYSKL